MARTTKTPAAPAATEAGTQLAELSLEQRASQALAFDETRAQLVALADKHSSLVTADGDDNFAAAKSALGELKSTRVAVEKTGKAARDEATKYGKLVIAKERELLALIAPEEARLRELVEAEELRRAEAVRAAREAEERRARAIEQAFARVRSLPAEADRADLAGIDALIAEAQKLLDDQSHLPDDLRAAARYEAQLAINGCKAVRDRKVQAAKDAAELEELRRERAERLAREERAARNAAEAARAAQVVAEGSKAPPALDDDLPPTTRPAAAPVAQRVPASHAVPARSPQSLLLSAAKRALDLLYRNGWGQDVVFELRAAIEAVEADAEVPR